MIGKSDPFCTTPQSRFAAIQTNAGGQKRVTRKMMCKHENCRKERENCDGLIDVAFITSSEIVY